MSLGSLQFASFSVLCAVFLAGCGASAPDPLGTGGAGTAPSGTGGNPIGTGGTPSGTGGAPGGGAPSGTGGDPGGGAPGGLGASGSSGAPGSTGGAPIGTVTGPTTPVTGGDAIPSELGQALVAASAQDGAGLRASHPVELGAGLGYDPSTAAGLSLIQASPLALTAAQLGKLSENGLVIAKSQTFPTFVYGYKNIYAADLPVYVSADSVLYAVHHSFDKVLEFVEGVYLVPELDALLDGVRATLATSAIDDETKRDVDLYVAVAKSLLKAQLASPVAGGDAQAVASLFAKAQAGEGHEGTSLFGTERDEDFSQFKPRGHYTHSEVLKQYFRAMMWLGRVDLRVIETQGDGSQLFRRPQFNAAVALYETLGTAGREHWAHIDEIVGWFVGERDSATVSDMPGLLTTLGAATFEATKALSDRQIIDALAAGWGAQRIASRIIINDGTTGTLPLDRSFALFGQRYTVDSHVFVNTTYDRVEGRMMPNPLDVAFAALGNNAALTPLTTDLASNASYAGGLAKTRVLVDSHEAPYWEGSLYTQWLGALRTLSPRPGDQDTLPSVALMPAFRERILNTQLASWAELRRDTILYAKQSYTTGVTCEFPDAYVDPYPEFYARLGRFAQQLRQIADRFPAPLAAYKPKINDWATNFITVSGYLEQMAQNQRSGAPHNAELMAFINDAVNWQETLGCGQKTISNLTGWYTRLFFSPTAALEFDPTIADVHTQPTDEFGNDVGRVLHVGTGFARTMVVTVNTCSGPRAYMGLASSYGERITEGWKRLNDQEWSASIQSGPFPDVAWTARVLSE